MSDPTEMVFDTGALIDIYRGRRVMRPRFQAVVEGELTGYLSVLSEAELWRGVKPTELERHEAILSHFNSIALESEMARLAGAWMQKYEAHGLGWMDALIVATAKKSGFTLLTRDAKLARVLKDEAHFEVYPVT